MNKYKIIINSAKCLICGDILESKHRHDMRICRCGNLGVDGGYDYIKRSLRDVETTVQELSKICSCDDCSDCMRICRWKCLSV